MRISIVLLLFLLNLCALPEASCQEEDFSRLGGDEWNSYSESSKSGFALGFIVGAHMALEELNIFFRRSTYSDKRPEDLVPVYNITNSQLKEKLDVLYELPENRTIPIKDAAMIVCKELKRGDTERIEKEKRLLRLPPDEQRIVKRSNYLKEKVKRGEYAKYEVKDEVIIEKDSGEAVPLETEEEIVEFWTEQVFPEEAPKIKEVEVIKKDYIVAI
ncbi:MAG: hypothetical protein V3S04_04060, partial [Candidatus Omnitrophota bacterium]